MTSLDEIFNKWIDQQVNVVVDRPTGYTHPNWPDLVYETDYGFIPDTVGGDGKEVDVYVLDNSKEETS
jgi:inorganic pyrophosphatase